MIRFSRSVSSYLIPQRKIEPSNQDIFDETDTIPNSYQRTLTSHLLKYIPIPIASISHSVRFKKLSYLSGHEIKGGLLEEHSIHILIDCLFLTVTTSPIYNQSLPYNLGCHSTFCNFVTALYFFNTLCAVMSIICHALLMFAYVEIPALVFSKWIVKQENAIISANIIHMINSYLWLITVLLYPLATMSMFMGITCTFAGILPILLILLVVGTYATPGTFDSLHHSIKLRLNPYNDQLKVFVENDLSLYKESIDNNVAINKERTTESYLSVSINNNSLTLHDFLKSIDLQSFEEILRLHDITSVLILSKIENDDYRILNVSIGNRIKVKEELQRLQFI